MRADVPFNPNVKDGRSTQGLTVNKSNWANTLDAPKGQIDGQIATYESSSIDGWDWGPIIGIVLTALAIIGLLSLIYEALHRNLISWAILIWTAATIAASLAIPFSWQRYYLPLLLVAIILAANGLGRLIVRRGSSN